MPGPGRPGRGPRGMGGPGRRSVERMGAPRWGYGPGGPPPRRLQATVGEGCVERWAASH